ncbi:MAG: 4Fe-4S dicluster domain-containing protein [Clostridia bacterium]|nr:4Fe-4S dicluster domain-containing protein [Clostridia bacterium]
MYKFDTKVQLIKYKVLREVARAAFEDRLLDSISDIPKKIAPGPKSTMRCCVYKERAILTERIKLAMGGNKDNANIVEVIDIACDECPVSGHVVSDACRGCIAHRCKDVCPRDAIWFDEKQKAHIDKARCIECGKCAQVCPYSAIQNQRRPCELACKVKAISMREDYAAMIDNDKCIACGACVYQCPFGAISDKSYILEVIDLLKKRLRGCGGKLYAVVAPAISTQFTYAKLGQVISGIKALGFDEIVEAALGADMIAISEAAELVEKGFLTTSCCPAFVKYVKSQFPELAEHVSDNLSPAAAIGEHIKQTDPTARIVFIGPCTAKKLEFREPHTRMPDGSPIIDSVLTFEELQALFDSRDIDISGMKETVLDDASYYGRIFARSCGVSEAVQQSLSEQGIETEFRPVPCDGIEACRTALLKKLRGVLDGNFIEGMACSGGCIGGAGCLTHGNRDRATLEKHGRDAAEKTILEAIGLLENGSER